MNTLDASIVGLALAAIAGELWYFLRRRPRPAGRAKAPAQEFRITVWRGFSPDTVLAEVGRAVRLHVYRAESDPRSARFEFDSLEINKPLAEFATTTIEFIPTNPGDYRFRCGAHCEGHVIAQTGGDAARANLGRGHQKHG